MVSENREAINAQDSAHSIEMSTEPQSKKSGIETSASSFPTQPSAPTHSFVRRDAQTYGVKYKPQKQWGFWNPQQAKEKHVIWLRLLGRIGWAAKATIYSIIGGLACDNAVGDKNSSASPQGAFVLIGTANGGRGALVVLAIATATYSAWRFWEGIVGQGYDDNFSKAKNFFKFRLSPFVSGGVYIAYDVLIITTIPRDANEERNSLRNSTWPNNWRHSGIGKAGLVVCGLAFIAATIVQLEQFFTRSFHNTIKTQFHYMPQKYWKGFRIFVLTCGHLGVLGRAGIFVFAAVLFFRTLKKDTFQGKSAFGDALAQLQDSKIGQAALFIMGFLVILYGLFCVLSMYARFFPTPPPTGYKKQHRRQYNPEADLPQYGAQQAGFSPLNYAHNQRTQSNAGSQLAHNNTPPPQQHAYLSPMTNASKKEQSPAVSDASLSTGYPITGANGDVRSHANPGVTVQQLPEDLV